MQDFDIKQFRMKCSLAEYEIIKSKEDFYDQIKKIGKEERSKKSKIHSDDDFK